MGIRKRLLHNREGFIEPPGPDQTLCERHNGTRQQKVLSAGPQARDC